MAFAEHCSITFLVPVYTTGIQVMDVFFNAPAIFNGGCGGAYSITAVRTYVCPSRPSVLYVTQMVSMQYILKRLVYWIEILYIGI